MTHFEFTLDPVVEAAKLTKGLQNRAMRIAMNKGASVVKASVVSGAPVRYGYLKRSIRIRVRQYRNRAVWAAVVGPKSDFRIVRRGRKSNRKRRGRKESPHKPALYAHFLERGSKHAAAHPFLMPALNATAARYLETYQASLRQQIAAILAKQK